MSGYLIEKITCDNRRPGMPEEGYLVRYNPHADYGWLSCKSCATLEEAETFASSLSKEN